MYLYRGEGRYGDRRPPMGLWDSPSTGFDKKVEASKPAGYDNKFVRTWENKFLTPTYQSTALVSPPAVREAHLAARRPRRRLER